MSPRSYQDLPFFFQMDRNIVLKDKDNIENTPPLAKRHAAEMMVSPAAKQLKVRVGVEN